MGQTSRSKNSRLTISGMYLKKILTKSENNTFCDQLYTNYFTHERGSDPVWST